MRNIYSTIITILLLGLVITASATEDAKLSQPVTITFTNGRLHTVIEQIAKSTGVDVRCGVNDKDWQVRDIPVIVCVKDMPLGKLLRLIADSTHLAFTSTTTDKGNIIYRIYRDNKCKDELNAEWDSQCKLIAWDWKALSALGKMSNLDDVKLDSPLGNFKVTMTIGSVEVDSSFPNKRFSEKRKALARLVASLPPDTIDRIMDGEIINLTTKNAPKSSAVADLYRALWKYETENPDYLAAEIARYEEQGIKWVDEKGNPVIQDESEIERDRIINQHHIKKQKAYLEELLTNKEPQTADIDRATVTIKLIGLDDNKPQVQISVFPIVRTNEMEEWTDILLGDSQWLEYAPQPGEIPGLILPEKPDIPNRDLLFDIKSNKTAPINLTEESDLPILKTKLHLNLPKDKKLNYGDIVAAVAKASGFNIVLEDFTSHLTVNPDTQEPYTILSIDSDITLEDALKKLSGNAFLSNIGWWWSINSENKTIMGWNYDWRRHHLNLVSEDFINSLLAKANGNGLDLDDVTPIFNLTKGQQEEWIKNCNLFSNFSNSPNLCYSPGMFSRPEWQLYDLLTSKEKALAKSETGLPLYQIGMDRLRSYLNIIGRNHSGGVSYQTVSEIIVFDNNTDKYEIEQVDPEQIRRNQIENLFWHNALTNPEIAATIVMKVFKEKRPDGSSRYMMELKGEVDGEQYTQKTLNDFTSTTFPIYSAKRKAELGIK